MQYQTKAHIYNLKCNIVMDKLVLELSSKEQIFIYGGEKKNYRWINKEESDESYNFNWENN